MTGDTSLPGWFGTVVQRPSGMPVLHVRAALPGQDKTQGIEDAAHLTGLEDGWPWHELRSDGDTLGADKLRVQIWLSVLQEHFDDLAEVAL